MGLRSPRLLPRGATCCGPSEPGSGSAADAAPRTGPPSRPDPRRGSAQPGQDDPRKPRPDRYVCRHPGMAGMRPRRRSGTTSRGMPRRIWDSAVSSALTRLAERVFRQRPRRRVHLRGRPHLPRLGGLPGRNHVVTGAAPPPTSPELDGEATACGGGGTTTYVHGPNSGP